MPREALRDLLASSHRYVTSKAKRKTSAVKRKPSIGR